MDNEVKQLSRAQIDEYIAKLDHLKSVARLEVAQEIKEARSFGDISENAEYDAAMDKQANIEYQIEQVEKLLANVVEIDVSSIDLTQVGVGTTVDIRSLEDGSENNYQIVASSVADPLNNKISNESPVGRALIGRAVGDIVEVMAPIGVLKFEILNIGKQ